MFSSERCLFSSGGLFVRVEGCFRVEGCLFSSGGCLLEWRVVCFRIEDVFE